jgi:hypothetical protein
MQKSPDNTKQQTEQTAKQDRKRVHASAFCRIDIREDQPDEDQTDPEEEERSAKPRKTRKSDEEDQSDPEEEEGGAGSGIMQSGEADDLCSCYSCGSANTGWRHWMCPVCGCNEFY